MKFLLIVLTLAAALSNGPTAVHAAAPDRSTSAPAGKPEMASARAQDPPVAVPIAAWQAVSPASGFTHTGAMLVAGLGFMGTVTSRRLRPRATT